MKKMLVSDYDDTFYINEEDIKNNIAKVSLFRKNKNIFVIATGRSYLDFKKKAEQYQINVDYLIINHGATTLYNNQIISSYQIEPSVQKKILPILNLNQAKQYFACSHMESRVEIEKTELTKIHVEYYSVIEAKNIKKMIKEKYSFDVNCYLVGDNRAIEIVSKSANKKRAVEEVATLEKIDKEQIYVIGDGDSDVEMIKEYNGYCMKGAIEKVKEVSKKEYESVSCLLKNIEDCTKFSNEK